MHSRQRQQRGHGRMRVTLRRHALELITNIGCVSEGNINTSMSDSSLSFPESDSWVLIQSGFCICPVPLVAYSVDGETK